MVVFPVRRFTCHFCLAANASPIGCGTPYAAYGGVYIAVAHTWLWMVEGITPTHWDMIGAAIALVGMGIIALQPTGVP